MLQKVGIDRYTEIGPNWCRFHDRLRIASTLPLDARRWHTRGIGKHGGHRPRR
jgi:hypothetical protein